MLLTLENESVGGVLHVSRMIVSLPFDVDVTGLLTGQEITVLKNHVFRVPDDDTQLIPARMHSHTHIKMGFGVWVFKGKGTKAEGAAHPLGFRGAMSTAGPG